MTNTKHTRGRWYCRRGVSQMVGDGTTVAEIGPTSEDIGHWWVFSDADEHGDAEADARLIAAAPDLLEAAQSVVDRWDSPDWKDGRHTGEFIHALRQAIAKATSATPSNP